MRTVAVLFLLTTINLAAHSQLKITNVETLPLDKSQEWGYPVFSPDGKKILYTTSTFQGIWEYNTGSKSTRQVVTDPSSGYNFAISPDGKTLAYRRTLPGAMIGHRVQEIVTKNLESGRVNVVASGSNLSTPSFAEGQVIYTNDIATKNLQSLSASARTFVVGIENTKIAVVVSGEKRLLDPLKRGSYIWPMLSPDGKKIVASDMSRGTFVCDLNGKVLARLGKRNAAVWTRDGKWLISMNDKDDGHTITSSDLYCISPDGKIARQLTRTDNTVELFPQCSPTENKIVCSTLDGGILLLTYEEAKR